MEDEGKIKKISLRYLIIFLAAIPNFFVFYFIFTPLTIYPLLKIYNLFIGEVILEESTFYFSNNNIIEIIPACVAGTAYYLLFALNLSTPKISIKKRIYFLIYSFAFLLALNILRIFGLSVIFVNGSELFDSAHKLLWYFGTAIFVILIWFVGIKIFKVGKIPVYSDLKYLNEKANHFKRSKKNKNSSD